MGTGDKMPRIGRWMSPVRLAIHWSVALLGGGHADRYIDAGHVAGVLSDAGEG